MPISYNMHSCPLGQGKVLGKRKVPVTRASLPSVLGFTTVVLHTISWPTLYKYISSDVLQNVGFIIICEHSTVSADTSIGQRDCLPQP